MSFRRSPYIMNMEKAISPPENGTEIMDEIETMTKGWWRPSPGSVYPLLEGLVQEDLFRKRDDGKYELTQKAREEIGLPFGMHTGQPRTVGDMINEIGDDVQYFEDLSRSDKSRIGVNKDKIRGSRTGCQS